ncbi:hypothetical protein DIPPA_21453 [Diplonema papillatum]|nr:hypothetical protein DIPPA_21453 [Diplonema papillatum]
MSVHIDNRGETWQADFCTPPNGSFWQQLDAVNYTQPPHSTHFPDLLHVDRPCTPVHNVIVNNVYSGTVVKNFPDFSPNEELHFEEQHSRSVLSVFQF